MARALEARANSSLSIGLPIHEQLTGALNVYAIKPEAAGSDAVILGETFAGYAAVALANAHPYDTPASLAQQMQATMQAAAPRPIRTPAAVWQRRERVNVGAVGNPPRASPVRGLGTISAPAFGG